MPIIEAHLSVADSGLLETSEFSSLVISPSVEDISLLERRFRDASWTLYTAYSYRDGIAELRSKRMPVVLCASKLPDGDWKDVLDQLALLPDRPRLIVFSRTADEALWAEVLNAGGFDLLATPFQDEELVFTIGSAWLDWTGEQECHARRKHSHA